MKMRKKTRYFMALFALANATLLHASEISLTNLALTGRATASSAEAPSQAAIDGNPDSYWQSAGMVGTHWLEITLAAPALVDRIVLPLAIGADSLLAEVWANDQWKAVGSLPKSNPMISFTPITTQKIRLRSVTGRQLRIHEVEIFAHDPQPVFVNQAGYDVAKSKRFTAPLAADGTRFRVVEVNGGKAVFEGNIQGKIGDFSAFRPETVGPYRIEVLGGQHTGRSVPFWIAAGLVEKVAYGPAIQFMIDTRCWFGDSRNYQPTDQSADCPSLGVAWRDSHQFSFEIQSLLHLYFANPQAFMPNRMPIEGLYLGTKHELPTQTPEIVQLIHWAVDIYLRGKVNHTLLKEQLAYFLYAYPHLSDYIPRAVYEEARDYLFGIWGQKDIHRWQWHDIEHTGDLFQTYTFIGTGKGNFPPGHNIVPNLMMYEVAKREGRPDAQRYFDAAYSQTQWLLQHLDWADPRTTKGQRQGEHVTLDALAYFHRHYPQQAPKGIPEKIAAWATEMTRRADNLWDYRRYSDTRWIIPGITDTKVEQRPEAGFNEVGNIGGFAAPALIAAAYATDPAQQARLEQLALAYIDHIFGRNPTGRHFSFDAARDFEGVEMGWMKEYQGGAGILQTARGVLDGSPKETTYPYNPLAGDPGHTEGWVTFNTAWNIGLAHLSSYHTQIKVLDNAFSKPLAQVKTGQPFGIELRAPLNFDFGKAETVAVTLRTPDGKTQPVTLTETAASSGIFRAIMTPEKNWKKGKYQVNYGIEWHEKIQNFTFK